MKRVYFIKTFTSLAFIMLLGVMSSFSQATWKGETSSDFLDASNWDGDPALDANGDDYAENDLIFDKAAGGNDAIFEGSSLKYPGIEIKSGNTLYLNGGSIYPNDPIVMENNSAIIIDGGVFNLRESGASSINNGTITLLSHQPDYQWDEFDHKAALTFATAATDSFTFNCWGGAANLKDISFGDGKIEINFKDSGVANFNNSTLVQDAINNGIITTDDNVLLAVASGYSSVAGATVIAPTDSTVELAADGTYTLVDFVSASSLSMTASNTVTIEQSPIAGTVMNTPGLNIVTITATDEFGNVSKANINLNLTVPEGLVHSYTFETADTVIDVVGGLSGQLHGSKITVADGKATVSGATASTDGYISLDAAKLGLNAYDAITIEAYLETGDVLNSSYSMLAYFGNNTGGNKCFWIQPTRKNTTETRIETNNGTSTKTASFTGYELDNNKLHHVIAALTPDALKYYIDGILVASTELDGDYISTLDNVIANIFKGPSNWGDPNYNVSLEEFNIYNGTLDDQTILDNAMSYVGQSNSNLASLSVDGASLYPAFNSAITNYTVFDVENPSVIATALNNAATVTISDNKDSISVTSVDGTSTSVYTITYRTMPSEVFVPAIPVRENLTPDPECEDVSLWNGWGLKETSYEDSYSGVSSILLSSPNNSVDHCGYSGDGAAFDISGFTFKPNTTYRVIAMVKTIGGSIGFLASGSDPNFGFGVDTEGEWQLVDTTFTTGANAGTDFVSWNTCDYSSNCTACYIDNYEVYEINDITIAYVSDNSKVLDPSAAATDNDPIIKMLMADENINVEVLMLAPTDTVDLAGYDAVIAQEAFGSKSAIFTPKGALGMANIPVPFILNKAYAMKAGRGFASGTAGSGGEQPNSLYIKKVAESDLFKGIAFDGDSVKMFLATADDNGIVYNGTKAMQYATDVAITAENTLLASGVNDPQNATVCINDIPAGDTIGSEILKARMIAFSMNYGAICADGGYNMTDENLTLWRNAVYSLVGLVAPEEGYVQVKEECFESYYAELENLVPDPTCSDLSAWDGWGLKTIATGLDTYCGETALLLSSPNNAAGHCGYSNDGAALDIDKFAWQANTTYHLRVMVKTIGGPIGFLAKGTIDNGGPGSDFGFGIDTEGKWMQVDTMFTTSENPSSGFFSFNTCDYSSTATKTYIDNYELYALPEAPAIKIAYVNDVAKVMVEAAAQTDSDPIITMLKADDNFEVDVMLVAADSILDLSAYDIVVAQEGFSSSAAIFRPDSSLGIGAIEVPFIYNKAYAMKAGRGFATDATGAGAEVEGTLSVNVSEAGKTSDIFKGIDATGEVKVFNTGAADDGSRSRRKGLQYAKDVVISAEGTLLASGTDDPETATVCINDIPAGATIGSETLKARMITFCMNYGAICANEGTNFTDEGLTLWRNAIYSLAGLDVPAELFDAPEFVSKQEIALDGVGVYPNPVEYNLNVTGIEKGANITIINTVGQVIMKTVANSSTESISVETLKHGIYMMKVEMNGAASVSRFVKK